MENHLTVRPRPIPQNLVELFNVARTLTTDDRVTFSANTAFSTKRISVPVMDAITGEIRRGSKTGEEFVSEQLAALSEKAHTGCIAPAKGLQALLDRLAQV